MGGKEWGLEAIRILNTPASFFPSVFYVAGEPAGQSNLRKGEKTVCNTGFFSFSSINDPKTCRPLTE